MSDTVNKGGRPHKFIDQRQFEGMCQILCTQEEICHLLDCDSNTIDDWCQRSYGEGFSDSYKRFSAGGKMSIRRAQFKHALEGNTALLIWLGKTVLKQSEHERDPANLPDFTLNYSIPDPDLDSTKTILDAKAERN